jgi:hypothetical protein
MAHLLPKLLDLANVAALDQAEAAAMNEDEGNQDDGSEDEEVDKVDNDVGTGDENDSGDEVGEGYD